MEQKKLVSKKVKKLNNGGFSLVELLVAIVILGIVVVPFTRSFISAANTNAKAKKMLTSTTLAENVLEEFRTLSVNEAVNKFSGVAASKGYNFSEIPGTTFDANASMYKVCIAMTPEVTEYATVNSLNVTDIDAMTLNNSGLYAMNPTDDSNAIAHFDSLNETEKNSNPTSYIRKDLDWFNNNVTRTINVYITSGANITLEDGSSIRRVAVNVEIIYNCKTADSGKTVVSNGEYKVTKKIFDNLTSKKEFVAAYLVYSPIYSSKNGNKDNDVINIINDDAVAGNMYVIRQNTAKDSDASYGLSTYRAKINLQERTPKKVVEMVSDGLNSALSLRTNLYDLSNTDMQAADKYFKLSFKDKTTDTSTDDQTNCLTLMDVRSADGRSFLGANNNNIYKITVKVFNADADVTADSPVTELSGTKLQ